MNIITPHPRLKLILLPFIACIFFLRAATNTPAQELTLLTNAVVDSEGVFLSHVLMSTNPLPHLRLADAPQFGQAVVLTRAQVAELLQKNSAEPAITPLLGADKVRIIRRARPYNESEIRDQLTALLQNDYVKDKGELEIRFLRPWIPIVLPDEPLTLKVLNLPSTGVTPNCIVRFELSTKREILGSWQAPVSARVLSEVWVAKSPLRKDQIFAEADVARERRDILTLREALLPAQPESSLQIVDNIQAGAPIFQRSVRPRPVVFRGQVVEAQVLDGAMTVSLKVEVLENGAPGQFVRLRNVQSRREFRGKVRNDQTILVAL
jgi:flagellar basal body P-ring formation protein FlgA